jgi:hypothetical protein
MRLTLPTWYARSWFRQHIVLVSPVIMNRAANVCKLRTGSRSRLCYFEAVVLCNLVLLLVICSWIYVVKNKLGLHLPPRPFFVRVQVAGIAVLAIGDSVQAIPRKTCERLLLRILVALTPLLGF